MANINIVKKICNDMQKELDKTGKHFDVNYMSARVDALTTLVTTFDAQKQKLAKVDTPYIGCILVNPNISSIYSKPGTRTYDGNFSLVFFVDHSIGNETLDTISQFVSDLNGLYLVDTKDNKYDDNTGSLQSLKGLRRKYKSSVGIDGVADNGAGTLYQTYTVTIGVHVSNQIMGDDFVFKLLDTTDNDKEIIIDELVRTDIGGDNIENNTEESKELSGAIVTGSKEQYTFTKFLDLSDPFVIELLDMKKRTSRTIRKKYALKREIKGVNDTNEYVSLRTDYFEGTITNVTQEFDKGREAIISFFFEANDYYIPTTTQLPDSIPVGEE